MNDLYKPLFKFDLQFFASNEGGEKTEEPTAKKIEESRKDGQVAKSKELTNAVSLLALFVCLKVCIGFLGKRLLGAFTNFWGKIGEDANSNFDHVRSWQLFLDLTIYIVITILPFIIVAVVAAFLTQKVQIKWKITSKPMKPKFNKISPISGFKRMFSARALFDLLLNIFKIILFGAVSYSFIKDNMDVLYSLYDRSLEDCLVILFDMVFELGLKISVIYIIVAVADYAYQKFKHKKDLRMTKQEVKDEYKNQEGDPKVKSQQRQRMQQASRRRMMQSIPEADVVITNPTHFAVALKYDNTTGQAPLVVAKGADYMAMKIKDIARENDVEIVENKPLARMLYANVDVGNEIPAELYQSVAEVLAYVYRLKNKVS